MEYKFSKLYSWTSGKPISANEHGTIPVYGSNGIIGYTDNSKYFNKIILGRVGAYCGSVEYCPTEFNATDNTLITTCNEKLITYPFAFYSLKLMKLNNFAGGSAQPLITQGLLKHLKCDVPSIEKQKIIANILSAYDNLIENNNKRIKLLEQMAENLYKEWFVRFRFPGYEDVDFMDGFPKKWEKVKLDDVLNKIATGLNPRKNFVLGEGENFYVTIKNMADNTVYLDDKCDKVNDDAIIKINKRSDLKIGDLLFSGIGTIGRVCLIDTPTNNWNISESVFTMRANKKISSD